MTKTIFAAVSAALILLATPALAQKQRSASTKSGAQLSASVAYCNQLPSADCLRCAEFRNADRNRRAAYCAVRR